MNLASPVFSRPWCDRLLADAGIAVLLLAIVAAEASAQESAAQPPGRPSDGFVSLEPIEPQQRTSFNSNLIVVGIVSTGLIGAALTIMYRRKRAHPIVADISKPSSDKVPHLPAASALAREPCVFISYRREDSADITGRISDRLIQRFGRDAVFKDVDSIPLGQDFRKHLREAVGRCDTLLVIIGPRWYDAAAGGRRRLDDARDHLRIEVESALERSIPVIPVLVQGAKLPDEEDLPEALRPLAYRNAQPVRPDPDFTRDMERLIHGIESQFKVAPGSSEIAP